MVWFDVDYEENLAEKNPKLLPVMLQTDMKRKQGKRLCKLECFLVLQN